MLAYSAAIVIILMTGIGLVVHFNISSIQKYSILSIRTQRMTGYDDSVRFQVQNVITLLDSLYIRETSGELTETQAQTLAKQLVKSLRYGDNNQGYFWIDSTDYTLVAHPILPQSEGQNRYGLKDQNGVMIIQEIMKVVNKSDKGGFSEFYFTKADGKTVAPKRTYSMLFKPWGWVVSTGNYYDDIDTEINSISASIKSRFMAFYYSTLTVFVVLFIFLLIISFGFSKRFSDPIIETEQILQKMDEGDLTLRLSTVRGKTEISRMRQMLNSFAETMNKMIADTRGNIFSLNKVAGSLDESSSTISSEIKQITENSIGLARHAKVQKKTVNDTVATMTKMEAMIDALLKKIEEQNASVSQSSAAVEEMIANINSITQNVNKFDESFKTLSADSAAGNKIISNVIEMAKTVSSESAVLLDTNKVIEDVATQTNLLAMNAAIEAAHAGNAGRGFAVVSDEIRRLSENTAKQSRSITETLNKVIANIQSVTEASNDAGNVFSGMVHKISEDGTIVTEIRNAMEEQSAGSQQIVSTLNEIKDTTQTIESSSHTMNSSVQDVGKEIAELTRLADGLQSGTEEIEKATQTIHESIKSLSEMAVDNRTFADRLSSDTGKFTV
jgi:methyl-accepting chemotaxis protein